MDDKPKETTALHITNDTCFLYDNHMKRPVS